MDLELGQIDLNQRAILQNKASTTKRTWYSFFNEECQDALKDYLKVRQDPKRGGRWRKG